MRVILKYKCIVITLRRKFVYYPSLHSKNCGVKITPPVLIEDRIMHFTPVLNLRC